MKWNGFPAQDDVNGYDGLLGSSKMSVIAVKLLGGKTNADRIHMLSFG